MPFDFVPTLAQRQTQRQFFLAGRTTLQQPLCCIRLLRRAKFLDRTPNPPPNLHSEKSRPERSNLEKPAPEQVTPEEPPAGRYPPETEKPKAAISPWVVAPISGAVAAALVIGVGWMLGWPPVQRAEAPQANTATIDALAGRVGGLEARLAKPAEDPAEAARIAALEKSFASLREQSEKLNYDP